MKKLNFNTQLLFLFAVIALGTVACGEEKGTELTVVTKEIASNEAEVDAAMEDIDDFSSISLDAAQENAGGKVEDEIDDDRICEGVATFEGTKLEGTLTLDFGDGCIDAEGNIRTGKIIITYNGRYFAPGSVTTFTLEDYTINGLAIEGVRRVENITTDSLLTWNVTLTGGQITYEDGTVATREVERIRVWDRAPLPINDRILVTGVASGQTKNGVTYNSRITEELVFVRNCRRGRRGRIPVSGVNVITTDTRTITIDFGDGECDRGIRTSSEGTVEDFDL